MLLRFSATYARCHILAIVTVTCPDREASGILTSNANELACIKRKLDPLEFERVEDSRSEIARGVLDYRVIAMLVVHEVFEQAPQLRA